jgi:enoyl-[acyl-carrier-protein] reductase (NADH)
VGNRAGASPRGGGPRVLLRDGYARAPRAAARGIPRPDFVEKCDVSSDAEIDDVFAKAKQRFGGIDILVHAIAFANREDLAGRFVDTSRDGFLLAHNISVYSLIGLARAAAPLMPEGGSVVTMTYYGAEKVVPKYNVMGVAKAALEATVRYLASDLGPQGIRVNAISAGPIRAPGSVRHQRFPGLPANVRWYRAPPPQRDDR